MALILLSLLQLVLLSASLPNVSADPIISFQILNYEYYKSGHQQLQCSSDINGFDESNSSWVSLVANFSLPVHKSSFQYKCLPASSLSYHQLLLRCSTAHNSSLLLLPSQQFFHCSSNSLRSPQFFYFLLYYPLHEYNLWNSEFEEASTTMIDRILEVFAPSNEFQQKSDYCSNSALDKMCSKIKSNKRVLFIAVFILAAIHQFLSVCLLLKV
jgi:hypothetical protein